jgi:hypothetical protein
MKEHHVPDDKPKGDTMSEVFEILVDPGVEKPLSSQA